jgi:mRNA interferase MazF
VLLLSRDDAYPFLNKVLAAEITTKVRKIPIEIPLGPRDGLPKPCVANLDYVRTIPKHTLVERISKLPLTRIGEVKRALGYAQGWEELIQA